MSDFLPCLLPPPLSISESDSMSNWKLVTGVCMLLFFCQVCTDARSIQQCIGPYDRIVGNTCQPCPTCKRGWGLSEFCGSGDGENATCQRCVSGKSFNPTSKNRGQCRPCTDCQKHLKREVEFKCRSVADAQCGKCIDGYYNKHEGYLGDEKWPCIRCSYTSTHPACARWKISQTTQSSSTRSIPLTTFPRTSTTPSSTPNENMPDHSTQYLNTLLQTGDEGLKEVSTWSSSTNVLLVVFPILLFLCVAVPILAICVYCLIIKKNTRQDGEPKRKEGISAQNTLTSGHIGGPQYQKDTEDGTSNGEADDVLIDQSNEKTPCIKPQRLRHNSSSSSHSVNFGMDCDEIYKKPKKQPHEIGPMSLVSSQVLSSQAIGLPDAIKVNDVDIEEKRLYQDEKQQRASPESLFVKPNVGEPAAAECDKEVDADQSRNGLQTNMAATEFPKQHSSENQQLKPVYNDACLNNTVDELKTCHESQNIASLKTDKQQPLVTVQVFNCLAASHPKQTHTQSCLAVSHPNQAHTQSGGSMQTPKNYMPVPIDSMSAVTDDMNVFEKEQRDKMKQTKCKDDAIYKEAVKMTEDKHIDEIDYLTRDRLLYKILDAKLSDLHRLGAQLEVPEGDLRLLAKAEDLFIILEKKRVTVSALLIALRSIGHHKLVVDLAEWVLSKYAKTPNGALEVTMAMPIEETGDIESEHTILETSNDALL